VLSRACQKSVAAPGSMSVFVVESMLSKRERERPRRRLVEPLDVVDRNDNELIFGEHPQRAANRNGERARICRISRRLLHEERGLERAPLRHRQRRQHLIENVLE
jgi:hypothetical protein